jgi:glyoxylase I family protein
MSSRLTADVADSGLGWINHLRLTVTDIQRAQEFYLPLMEFMGYKLHDRKPHRLSWARRSRTGVFWFILTAAREEPPPAKHDLLSPGFHHLAWNADSRAQVDELYRLLLEKKATVLDPPAEYDYQPGYYAVYFTDPDGLKLEFVHIPAN